MNQKQTDEDLRSPAHFESFEPQIKTKSEGLAYEGIYGARLARVKDEILVKIYVVP